MREARNIPLKTPLRKVVVLSTEESFRTDLESLRSYVEEELNVRELRIVSDETEWGVQYRASPNFKALGIRLKSDLVLVQKALATQVTQADLKTLQKKGVMTVAGHELSLEEVAVTRVVEPPAGSAYAVACEEEFVALLDVTIDAALRDEGLARELVNRVQRLRKRAGLKVTDEVKVFCHVSEDPETNLATTLEGQLAYLCRALKTNLVLGELPTSESLVQEEAKLGSGTVNLAITNQ